MSDVIICIGTIGSSTFKKCLDSVRAVESRCKRVGKVSVISNKSPQCAWLNEMRKRSSGYKWCLQVDEDMYLNKNSLEVLLEYAELKEADGYKILNASSMLYDIFLKTKIGSLKLWSVEPLQLLEFRDVLGGDRDYFSRASELGYENISISKTLGSHDSAPTPAIAFKKYFEYTQKIRKFSGDKSAKKFNLFLKNKYKNDKSYISKKAYDGSCHGLEQEIIDRTKGRG